MTLYVAEAELGTVQPSRDFQILYHGYTVTRIANFCPKIIQRFFITTLQTRSLQWLQGFPCKSILPWVQILVQTNKGHDKPYSFQFEPNLGFVPILGQVGLG